MAIDTEERTNKNTKAGEGKDSTGNNKALKIILIVIGVIVVLGIIGTIATGFLIKKGTESLIENVTDGAVKIDSDRSTVTFKDDEGSEIKVDTGSGQKVPKDFPESDIPIYGNAKIESSSDMTLSDSRQYALVLSTNDSVSDVIEFYEDELSGDGWESSISSNSNDTSVLGKVNKSKNLNLYLSASNVDDKTRISMTVSIDKDE